MTNDEKQDITAECRRLIAEASKEGRVSHCCKRQVAEIALAALTAEPVAYTDAEELETLRKGSFADMFTPHEAYKADPLWMPLFTAPPAPVLLVPDGWKLVPFDPTEDMLVNGFESKPDERFSEPKVWAEYDAMSGCQQAAHRALLCWQAMLLAAPDAPHTAPIEPICATGGAEWVKPVPSELQQVILELRTYNPKSDEYGGKHIIPGWADRIEKALGIKSAAPEEE